VQNIFKIFSHCRQASDRRYLLDYAIIWRYQSVFKQHALFAGLSMASRTRLGMNPSPLTIADIIIMYAYDVASHLLTTAL
jgi:hypothetical protein